ncbi:TrmH family RNA methyltransferase [Enterovirga rhinocerotis]|uniref:23S rRNA (Guanosine2251-2'-O)-methyltransferase n=1 Tax=Enterovirga rhinocerotis TaxID=1339210 RepID=A0A4R7C4K8_9HYPH|nr:RNA methyltransferase [Enterovirga rhinocerotis]TDR93101.1 23S rRNA (guanosine2251-2'-O)-methyltransferase [Enterovirga rhinocerotis]
MTAKPPPKPPRARAPHGRKSWHPPSRAGGPRPPRRDLAARPDDAALLYGFHPVIEALGNPKRRIRRLLLTENALGRLKEERPDIAQEVESRAELVRPDEISRLVEPDAVHQGVYLEADPLEPLTLADLGPDALVLALDQITDPHNVGAITRTAAAFGVDALLVTARHSPNATGVLAKAASGGLEHVPQLVVRNLSDALEELGRRGFRRIGLDSEGDARLQDLGASRPTVIVLGAEGRGLRQRTRSVCDVVARLDMPGAIKSLNVSNAAAIALYALSAPVTEPAGSL